MALRPVQVLGIVLLGLLPATAIPGTQTPTADADEKPPAEKPVADAPPARAAPQLLGPRDAAGRKAALSKYGGNSATEAAVDRGLDWLARHQQPSGLWDADGFVERCKAGATACEGIGKGQHGEAVPCPFDVPISALATLAFLSRGVLPGNDDQPHSAVVEKALAALASRQQGSWGLALATQALAEAEAAEGKGRFKEAVERGAQALIQRRQKDGAWGYAAGMRPGSDVPFTALAVQALLAARDAGVEVPKDLAKGIDRFLGSLEIDKGRLAYLKDGRRYGYTPTTSNAHCGAALRELLRVGRTGAGHRAHMGVVAKRRPVWKISFKERKVPGRGKVKIQMGHLSLYQWWYGTIATFHAGGGAWSSWFGKLKGALVGHQRKTGCARGSWDPLGTYERQTGGRVFATALAVLMLEQPYRHRRAGKKRK